MRIEFDEAKRAATINARGLDMARAEEVFAGATLTVEDDRQDYGEVRYITIGFLDEAMVVLVWTRRDDVHRIISMRRANERERRLYGPRF
ncbi:MAG: BrnT family toxin [Gemmatimonadetes bacterium]|nr:BrnT family toxin [Gemmatimonadota bacterium]MCY3611845.1 BrnT family toxin [Gemmatimonadota bacterium]MCY3679071.1 BrnT family toxin [Gemmatimonadota bacterium]MYA41341.1 BrnT family toxin [Gemmatimonadota bacterium]MYE91964.1 BrnT family toxin [Gemmatimonadota bacterium]